MGRSSSLVAVWTRCCAFVRSPPSCAAGRVPSLQTERARNRDLAAHLLTEIPLNNSFSTREWCLMLAAAAWGATLGALPGAQFTSVLLGPPVAYLFLRKHPLLSWRIPILASAISMALKERDPQRSYTEGSVLPAILLISVVQSLFSVTSPYIFQRRIQSDRKDPATLAKTAKMSFGVGFLVFLACGLILVGLRLCQGGLLAPRGKRACSISPPSS